ncbi:MAG: diguanylate cyclase [Myxococcales bacterium]|nr:diguanylate cyclase [Myxococcales bacterium]MCB9716030.1 diguanylate cyclase [Myxococcales bacterium]
MAIAFGRPLYSFPGVAEVVHEAVERLERENLALRRAIVLLHRIANLSRESLELRPVCYATLTGVTAGVGLGLNRAMLFFADSLDGGGGNRPMGTPQWLRGVAGVGPVDREEADRVWKSIAAEEPDLHTLYEAGLRAGDDPGALDRRVRETVFDLKRDYRVCRAFRGRELVGVGEEEETDDLLDPATGIAAPLRGRLGVHGVLYADNRFTGTPVDEITALVFGMVADHTARAIENARRYEDLARAARTDALTGLGHHGALMDALTTAVLEAQHTGQPLSVAMIDLDDFKAVNDTHGHPLGDRLLVEVADRLRRVARVGSVFRYGGEEFTVLLPGADLDDAVKAGERLRLAVSERPIEMGNGGLLPVTCSIGVATLAPRWSGAELVDAADQALLRAKGSGKNQVVARQ